VSRAVYVFSGFEFLVDLHFGFNNLGIGGFLVMPFWIFAGAVGASLKFDGLLPGVKLLSGQDGQKSFT